MYNSEIEEFEDKQLVSGILQGFTITNINSGITYCLSEINLIRHK